MKLHDTPLHGVKLLELDVFGDARGFFCERFSSKKFLELGLPIEFVQDNHSRSAPGVVRGLHYQRDPDQAKLVGVTRGSIWDVVVDIRAGSPTFGEHFAVELSDTNGRMLYVPAGYAHGFCVLGTELADVLYKVDGLYNPHGEGGILYDDPDLQIPWPVRITGVSARDAQLDNWERYCEDPVYHLYD